MYLINNIYNNIYIRQSYMMHYNGFKLQILSVMCNINVMRSVML